MPTSSAAQCGVQILSVNLCGNSIVTKLSGPPSNIGVFELVAVLDSGPGSDVFIVTGNRSPGTYTDSFPLGSFQEGGKYSSIMATYWCGGVGYTHTFSYIFKCLGTYRHSQYNTPDESNTTCQTGGGTTNVCFTTSNCAWESGSLYSTFKAKVDLNGSGKSISKGNIQPEGFCTNRPQMCQGLSAYRKNVTITPACSGAALNNTTVARKPNHPDLGCGRKVCIVRPALGNVVKTVTDLCPGCVTKQLDNYTTDGRCSGIVDYGDYITFKVP